MESLDELITAALDGLQAWEDVVPEGTKLLHVTKNLSDIQERGFLSPSALAPEQRTFEHAGYRPSGDRVSLTWSQDRAGRYLACLRLMVAAANGRVSPLDALLRHPEMFGRQPQELKPSEPGTTSFGSTFWEAVGALTADEQWSFWELDSRKVSGESARLLERSQKGAWDVLVAVDRAARDNSSADRTLGVVDPKRERFLDAVAPELAVVEVELEPRALVDVRAQEQEVQAHAADVRHWARMSLI